MTRKTYRVWTAVLDAPNEWQDMTTIGRKTDMTSRQASAVISHIYDERMEKESAMVRFSGTPRDVVLMRREITMACFGITDEDVAKVHAALSDVGAVTISDISAETGFGKNEVARILKLLDDVESIPDKTQTLYYIESGARGPLRGFSPS